MIDKLHVEDDRYDAVDENGDVKPYHDVFNDDFNDTETDESAEFDYDDIEEEAEVGPAQDHEVGAAAVKELAEIEPGVDLYPGKPLPPEHTRLAFGQMTEELFETMKNDDKRFVALSIWRADKRGAAYTLPRGMVSHSRWWIKTDKYSAFYKRWNEKYDEIIRKHKKAGDGAPWVEIYQGKIKGEKVTKARVKWDKGYGIAMKNAYYHGELSPEVTTGASGARTYFTSQSDAIDHWQRKKELGED